jgi:hypothetical protein
MEAKLKGDRGNLGGFRLWMWMEVDLEETVFDLNPKLRRKSTEDVVEFKHFVVLSFVRVDCTLSN